MFAAGLILLAAVPLLGQPGGGLAERIQKCSLNPEQRQELAASFSRKDFTRVEALLAAAATNAKPPAQAAEYLALLGALEFVGGRMSQAAGAFQSSNAISPLGDQDRFTMAMALIDLGDVRTSRAELTRLSESHPDRPLYLYWLARLDYGQRLYEASVEKLKTVVRLDPQSARGYDNLGLSYDMLGLTGEARNAFAKAAELNRKLPSPSPWPPHNLGFLLLRLELFHDAETALREALKYDPNFALAHYHLGRALEKQGQNEGAIEAYKSAAALDKTLAEPLYSLGLLYRRSGRTAEAASALAEYKKRRALSP